MNVERMVSETIGEYGLISEGDKVIVALSGGKDSTSILYILKELGYDVHGLMIDLYLGEWSDVHRENMVRFCGEMGVPLTVVDLKEELGQGICFIKAVLKKRKGLTGCAVCGVVKRWVLNKWARKLGGDKLVTGHNLDDEAQNVLMNYLKGNVALGVRSAPMTGEGNVGGFVQRVKPLFFVPESKCPCAFGTYRVETRDWMSGLSDREKLKIVEGFMGLDLKVDGKELRGCVECGEPSSGEVCNFCGIVGCL
jgi:tRNA(Ile)-lysidine synthase TilS/MesJ